MRTWWELDRDRVPGHYIPPCGDDRHYAGLPDKFAVSPPSENRRHESSSETVELDARVPQPGHLNHRRGPQRKASSTRQCQQVNAPGRDVLTYVAGSYRKPRAA
jgi:hypothetical protein